MEVSLNTRAHRLALRRNALLIAFLATAFLHTAPLQSQVAGHYLGGATGLENGSAAPPGAYAIFFPLVNHVNSVKGPAGHTVLNVDLTVAALMPTYAETIPTKFLGGSYGWVFIIPAVNTRFVSNEFNTSDQAAGVSDIYFSPIVLGWTKGNVDFTVNYGFYAPTGSFDPALALNPGLGYWEHQIQAGSTYNAGKAKLWNASFLTTWEISQTDNNTGVKPGPMFTGEYGVGRRFFNYQMNAGVAGFGYQKLSPDSGNVNPLVKGVLDRQMGIGPEFKYTNIKWRLGFDLRVEQQFAVEAKTQGPVFVLSITYLTLFPPKK